MHKHKLMMRTSTAIRMLSILALLFVFASSPFVVASYESIGEDSASLVIGMAEEAVVSAYLGILDAERVGADVSYLTDQLSNATGLLVQAHLQYEAGNLSEAFDLANDCYITGVSVEIDAYELRDQAVVDRIRSFWLTIAAWFISLIFIVCGTFLSWRIFKRRYHRMILRMKPEVSSNESQ